MKLSSILFENIDLSKNMPTRVLFRVWKQSNNDGVALLLDMGLEPGRVVAYEHLGGHGEGDLKTIMRQTTPAPADVVRELSRELTAKGYHLLPYHHTSISHIRELEQSFNQEV